MTTDEVLEKLLDTKRILDKIALDVQTTLDQLKPIIEQHQAIKAMEDAALIELDQDETAYCNVDELIGRLELLINWSSEQPVVYESR